MGTYGGDHEFVDRDLNGQSQCDIADVKKLIYTVAFDYPSEKVHASMARLMVASVLRSGFDGDILLFHNQNNLLFEHGRKGLVEIRISEDDIPSQPCRRTAHRLKLSVRELFDFSRYEKVMFLDADCIAFQDPSMLMNQGTCISYQSEPGMPITLSQFNGYLTEHEFSSLNCSGVNSGTFVVDGREFLEIMSEWDRIDSTEPMRGDWHHEQGAWNRIILDERWPNSHFPEGAIVFPYFPFQAIIEHGMSCGIDIPVTVDHPMLQHFTDKYICDAVVAHVLGAHPPGRRLAMMFGLYTMRYFTDPEMTLFHLLDS